MFKTRSIK